MNRRVIARAVAAATAGLAFVLAGCASTAGSGQTTAAGTVAVNVGTMTIHLPKGHLRIGVFMNGMTNIGEQNFVAGVKSTASAAGATVSVFDANYDVATQQNQFQAAATNKSFDAIITFPVDGQQSCNMLTTTLPQANIAVVVSAGPICGRTSNVGNAVWAPGTLSFVGGDSTLPYQLAWAADTARLNPGPQQVLVVVGPQLAPFTAVEKEGIQTYSAKHPEFHIQGYLYTDYTTQSGYTGTVNYLQAHQNTTVIMSVYSPDLTRGVVTALQASGKLGKIKVSDLGGSRYSIQQIMQGNIQLTMPYTLTTEGQRAAQSILNAQAGKVPERFVSEFPVGDGTPTSPLLITKANASSFKPEY
jgi:ribose transport system substrate-binding protein